MTQPAYRTRPDQDSIAVASLWMVGLGILLGWIPVLGPALAGFVGGRKAGTIGRALGAAIIPAVVLGVLVAIVLALFDLPVLGAVTGLAVSVWAVVQAVPLLAGAALGGWVDENAG